MPKATVKKKAENLNLTCNPIVEVPIAKANKTLTVDLRNVTQAGLEWIVFNGLKQGLNDAHSQVKSDEDGAAENALAAAKRKLAKIQAGTVTVKEGFGKPKLDPIFKEARTIVLEALRAAGVKPKTVGKIPDEATLAKVMQAYKIPAKAVQDKAKAIVETRGDAIKVTL